MEPKQYSLRAHHLLNLVYGYENDYSKLADGLRTAGNSVNKRYYSDSDAKVSKEFYLEITSNPKNIVNLINGIDDRCKVCSNYNKSSGCSAFLEEKVNMQDEQILKLIFPHLKIGDKIPVSDLLFLTKSRILVDQIQVYN